MARSFPDFNQEATCFTLLKISGHWPFIPMKTEITTREQLLSTIKLTESLRGTIEPLPITVHFLVRKSLGQTCVSIYFSCHPAVPNIKL